MDPETKDAIHASAIEWHIRLRDGDDADWEAFTDWLALSPEHAQAYRRVEDADLALAPLLPDLVFREAANDTAPGIVASVHRRRGFVAGGALAAGLAAVLVAMPFVMRDRYEVTTAPGENQIVTLDPGTRITLNGSTRMVFDRNDPRFAELTTGEALFHVRHDSRKPFRLQVGDNVVEDAGTIFNVIHDARSVRVGVAEGKVLYNPGRNAVALGVGQELTDQQGSGTIRVTDTPAASVGAWQRGQLIYSGAPMQQVAEDLSRALGLKIRTTPEVANRPFVGTIALEGSPESQLERLKPALNVRLEADGDGWVMTPADGER